ncbi:hypothetical protein B0H14DRAFT_3872232, partial [Mycena olivaceomarginata]
MPRLKPPVAGLSPLPAKKMVRDTSFRNRSTYFPCPYRRVRMHPNQGPIFFIVEWPGFDSPLRSEATHGDDRRAGQTHRLQAISLSRRHGLASQCPSNRAWHGSPSLLALPPRPFCRSDSRFRGIKGARARLRSLPVPARCPDFAALILNKVPSPKERAALAEVPYHALGEFSSRDPAAITARETRRFETVNCGAVNCGYFLLLLGDSCIHPKWDPRNFLHLLLEHQSPALGPLIAQPFGRLRRETDRHMMRSESTRERNKRDIRRTRYDFGTPPRPRDPR